MFLKIRSKILQTYIIHNETNALQLYLHTELVAYDGWCKDKDNTHEIFSYSHEDSVVKCKEKCYSNQECTAFSYESGAPRWLTKEDAAKSTNCYLMKGGPYITGSSRPNIKCYIPERGMLISFTFT